jgi:type I restriction enzyme M protein
MSAQGDAGQFRTPRHIIDFMVDVLDPTKDDTILDPACGTGGFLVSSYNHILEKHDGKDDPNGNEKPLTPAERKKLTQNLAGYDIDPSMVRIAQVNMYLHQFKNPQIFQYDGLTSEERWNDKFDVILANPPFMSPKGGIKPHNKFGIQSNRSEVLFVDYIASHLKPTGRAAIVVPEGIISQSGKAYKALRKSLVETGLHAVVSLPSGVFQPYSGVKTCILFIDNKVARDKSEIAFIKISADGFDLGATKRITSQNDLPVSLDLLQKWKNGDALEHPIISIVSKEEIAKNGDYNLSGERYRTGSDFSLVKWPIVSLAEIATLQKGSSITQKDVSHGDVPVVAGGQKPAYFHNVSNRSGNVVTVSASGAYAGFVNYFKTPIFASDCTTVQSNDEGVALTRYLYLVMKGMQDEIYKFQQGSGQPHVYAKDLLTLSIPLPPPEIQQQIVAELEGYEAIISGAKQIVDNWRPQIVSDPDWTQALLGDIASFEYGVSKSASETGEYRFVRITDIDDFGLLKTKDPKYIDLAENERNYILKNGDILMARTGATFGKCLYFESDSPSAFAGYLIRISLNSSVLPRYFWMYTQSLEFERQKQKLVTGGGQPQFNANALAMVELAVPSLEVQAVLIAAMEMEKLSVDSARKLIETYEAKTQAVIAKLWSE